MNLPPGLLEPPREFGVMPFWFWNDALDEGEIVRQIDDMERHGVTGFVIHPRVGLPRELGWLSNRLLAYYHLAIEEARRRDMRVVLYDEGMYPSGSSSGQVVAANPAFACRCLAKIDLPPSGAPLLGDDERLLAIVPRQDGSRMAVIDRRANSVIRGLHYRGEGPEEETPPAADLLNPAAVAAFLNLVYETFARHFSPYFGQTVLAIFTDEPSLLGRGADRDARPGTSDILGHVHRLLGYDFTPHLPALWHDDEPDAARFRADYHRAVRLRLEETYYRQLSEWCERHGIALAGHPERASDIGVLRYFQIPGQDLVWRWVLPDHPSALEGAESTQAKCSSSAALHNGRRRNSNECCGAYGHELTWEEMQWLARWCFIRGVNLLFPHAFYYSIRGPRRDERPPDVGPHSPWWPRYRDYADACRRLSWINSDSEQICEVAILAKADDLPWRAAATCFRHQVDFNYLEERDLLDRATVDGAGIHLGGMTYRALIVEWGLDARMERVLELMVRAGGVVLAHDLSDEALADRLKARVRPDIVVTPAAPALRLRHLRKEGWHLYLLFNEEQAPLQVDVAFPVAGTPLLFDAVTGEVRPLPLHPSLRLAGHELQVVMISDPPAGYGSHSLNIGR